MQPGRLIFLALAGTSAAALSGVPHLSAPADQGLPAAAQAPVDQTRLNLTPEQVMRSSAAGLLPEDTRSILNISKRMKYGEFVWDEEGVPPGRLLVRVNLQSQIISVFRGGHEIGTAVILYGAESHETPLGSFPVLAKFRDHRSSIYDAAMPFTLRLTADGVAIHGSDVRWGAATHGCVGVPIPFARQLFEAAEIGDTVEILTADASA